MVARGLVAVSFAVLGTMVVGCGKGSSGGAGTTTSKTTGSAVAPVKSAQLTEKEKMEKVKAAKAAKAAAKDPNAPPRPPVKHLDFPNTFEGATALAGQFVAPGTDPQVVAKSLQPDLEDYDVVFTPDVAGKLRHEMEELWEDGNGEAKIPKDRTIVKVWKATVEELLAGKGEHQACVDSYKGVAKMVKPGIVVHCLKFQKPGEMMGTAFDGLIYVRGHWAIFPRPEKILQHIEDEAAEEAREKAEKEAKDKAAGKK